MTASESAPAVRTACAFSNVMPPIAQSGFSVNGRKAFKPSRPSTGSGFSLEVVAKMGPIDKYSTGSSLPLSN